MPDSFPKRLLRWYDVHGRHDLPWQHPRTAYRVWIAEVMLQQTQVITVIPYFLRFVEKYPKLRALAATPLDDVLALWSGLGYYNRARNLHRAAQICVERQRGALPRDFDALAALPGIGRSTAGAILAQAHGLRFAILDGNVKRVLARFHGVRGWPGDASVQKKLWEFAEAHTPHERIADYTQAIMDLGATVCARAKPRCTTCPLKRSCVAHREGSVAQLPERKPSRALPTRKTIMLLLRDRAGRILLERRPPTGVWAQLWSLPEADSAESVRHRLGANQALHPLPPFVHAFSHYRLDITPLTGVVASARGVADSPQRRWLLPDDVLGLGVPAPVRRLIASIEENP
ncbi:MAG: A/G-specific adenine glycosylase [Xanthomonadaceae bacterium]|nr:A/G-specific adenine glycosylase [Xanthomonadaceae bacterium]